VGPLKGVEAEVWLPDLLAKEMLVTAAIPAGPVSVRAVVENIGLGSATGPFTIAVWVAISTDSGITEYAQNFDVPASVTLWGKPIFEPAVAAAMIVGGGEVPFFKTTYVTPPMEVPLEFVDVEPYAQYTGGFTVDINFQVSELRRDNDTYTWPGKWWYLSEAGLRTTRKPVVREIPASRVRA
jgi:hypothetical protein